MSRPSTTPVSCSIRSARVDLPWSMWAMMQKLRMIAGSVEPGCGTGTGLVGTEHFQAGGWSCQVAPVRRTSASTHHPTPSVPRPAPGVWCSERRYPLSHAGLSGTRGAWVARHANAPAAPQCTKPGGCTRRRCPMIHPYGDRPARQRGPPRPLPSRQPPATYRRCPDRRSPPTGNAPGRGSDPVRRCSARGPRLGRRASLAHPWSTCVPASAACHRPSPRACERANGSTAVRQGGEPGHQPGHPRPLPARDRRALSLVEPPAARRTEQPSCRRTTTATGSRSPSRTSRADTPTGPRPRTAPRSSRQCSNRPRAHAGAVGPARGLQLRRHRQVPPDDGDGHAGGGRGPAGLGGRRPPACCSSSANGALTTIATSPSAIGTSGTTTS